MKTTVWSKIWNVRRYAKRRVINIGSWHCQSKERPLPLALSTDLSPAVIIISYHIDNNFIMFKLLVILFILKYHINTAINSRVWKHRGRIINHVTQAWWILPISPLDWRTPPNIPKSAQTSMPSVRLKPDAPTSWLQSQIIGRKEGHVPRTNATT